LKPLGSYPHLPPFSFKFELVPLHTYIPFDPSDEGAPGVPLVKQCRLEEILIPLSFNVQCALSPRTYGQHLHDHDHDQTVRKLPSDRGEACEESES